MNKFQYRILNWQQLATMTGISGVCDHTIQNHMQDLNYYSCIACSKSWISSHMKKQHVEFSHDILSLQPNPENWKNVWFSDEVHFSLESQKKLWIIQKSDKKYCADCIQERGQPDEKDLCRIHAWEIIGWNYKKLILYETENKNGKMNQKTYIQLLSIVEPDLHGFIFKEDNDSGHTGAAAIRWHQEFVNQLS